MGDDKNKDAQKAERDRQFDLVDDLIGAAVDASIGLGVDCDDVVDIMLHTIYEHYRDNSSEGGHAMTVDQAVAALATKVAEFMAAETAQDHDDGDEEPRPPSEKPS